MMPLVLAASFGVGSLSVDPVGATTLTSAPSPSPVSVGGGQICATVVTGEVKCLGLGNLGQLGYFYGNVSPTPYDAGSISTASAVSAGSNSTCALLFSGGVDCWGYNYYGELGNGGVGGQYSTSPVTVSNLTTATDVAMGQFSACSVLSSGVVDCWGQNAYGDLGNGSTALSNVPVQVSSITNAQSVSVGSEFACAVLATGSIQCWGDNTYGQLGDGGAEASSDVPVNVSSITNAVAVSASPSTSGRQSACALLATGSVECWGDNTYGELGTGSTTASNVPVVVSSITNATSVSTGADFACAVLATGAAQCWGKNDQGELGNSSITQSSIPVNVSSLTNVSAISAGAVNACAVVTGGALWCWGLDNYDQLGYAPGTPNYSNVPVLISGLNAVSPTPSSYVVSYDAQGGTVSPTSATFSVGGSALTLPTPSYVGYNFAGWFSAASGGTLVSSPFTPTGTTTLYARWTRATFVVTYDAQGGTVSPTSAIFTVGGSALALPIPSLAGHSFLGWFSASSGGILVSSPFTPTGTTTLYARWATIPIPVIFIAQGAVVTPQYALYYGGAPLDLPTPSLPGYSFSGWYSSVTGALIASPFAPTQRTVLFAHWTPLTSIVSLDAMGGTSVPLTLAFSTGGASIVLPTPTYAGHIFTGWYSAPTGGNEVSSPLNPVEDVTLYAHWSLISYVVTFDPRGGSVGTSRTTVLAGDHSLTLPAATNVGHTFVGWFTSATGGRKISSPFNPSTSSTLYARWKPYTFRIDFDADGGRVTQKYAIFTFGRAPLHLPVPTFAHRKFKGWYSAHRGGHLLRSPWRPTKSATIYGHWTVKVHSRP